MEKWWHYDDALGYTDQCDHGHAHNVESIYWQKHVSILIFSGMRCLLLWSTSKTGSYRQDNDNRWMDLQPICRQKLFWQLLWIFGGKLTYLELFEMCFIATFDLNSSKPRSSDHSNWYTAYAADLWIIQWFLSDIFIFNFFWSKPLEWRCVFYYFEISTLKYPIWQSFMRTHISPTISSKWPSLFLPFRAKNAVQIPVVVN